MRSMWIRCVDYQRSRHRYLHAYSKEVDIYEEEVYTFLYLSPPLKKVFLFFHVFLPTRNVTNPPRRERETHSRIAPDRYSSGHHSEHRATEHRRSKKWRQQIEFMAVKKSTLHKNIHRYQQWFTEQLATFYPSRCSGILHTSCSRCLDSLTAPLS